MQVTVIFTLGYSPTYPEETVRAARFVERVLQLYEAPMEVPSVKLTIVR